LPGRKGPLAFNRKGFGDRFVNLEFGQTVDDERDLFVATIAIAIAIANGRPLVSNNTGHHQRLIYLSFPLEIENWRNS
jgi:hypothetical protein